MWKAIICFPFVFSLILDGVSSCADLPPKCGNAVKDSNEAIRCHFSKVFQEKPLDNVISEVGVMLCQKKSNEQMAKEFKSIILKNAAGPSALMLMPILNDYTGCLKKQGTTIEKEVPVISKALLEKFQSDYNKLKKAADKAKCNPAEVKKSLFEALCPLLTKINAEKVVAAIKAAQKKEVFDCAVQKLDTTVVFINKYKKN